MSMGEAPANETHHRSDTSPVRSGGVRRKAKRFGARDAASFEIKRQNGVTQGRESLASFEDAECEATVEHRIPEVSLAHREICG